MSPRFLLVVGLALVAGCARYEYDLTEPPEVARHIGRQPVTIAREPLRYTFQTEDSRLVVRITNPTGEPITLLGDQSVVVDPEGQSHPLPTQTIASSSFAKLILPPLRPFYQTDPTWHLGLGVGAAYPYGYYGPERLGYPRYPYGAVVPYDPLYPYEPPLIAEPLYLSAGGQDIGYWDWDNQGVARLRLVYRRGQETFDHEFTFRRVKA